MARRVRMIFVDYDSRLQALLGLLGPNSRGCRGRRVILIHSLGEPGVPILQAWLIWRHADISLADYERTQSHYLCTSQQAEFSSSALMLRGKEFYLWSKSLIELSWPTSIALLILTSHPFTWCFFPPRFSYSSSKPCITLELCGCTIPKRCCRSSFWQFCCWPYVVLGILWSICWRSTSLLVQIEAIFGSWKFLILYLMSRRDRNLFCCLFSP